MKRLRFWRPSLCIIVLCLVVFQLRGQVSKIDKLIHIGKYYSALPLVKQKFEEKKTSEWRLKLAICQFYTNQLTEAQKNLINLSESKDPDPIIAWYLGKIAHQNNLFQEAIAHYKRYLRRVQNTDPLKRSVVLDIKRCANGLKLPTNEHLCVVDNLGENVNTAGDELAPVPSATNPSKIYFSSNRPEVVGGLRDKEGLSDELLGNYCSDMFASYIVDGEWKGAESLGNFTNSARIDRLLDISADGKLLYFFKGFTAESGEILIDTFRPETENMVPEQGKLVAPIFPSKGDVYLQVFNNTFMVFASQRSGGYGGYDLYWTELRDSTWSEPINFGPNVNSAYDEICPFLALDGRTLFFSRNSDESVGGFDIFKAKFVDHELKWSKPVNAGFPINSSGDDLYFRLSKDGRQGFLASNRKDGQGGFDLYDVIYNESQREQSEASSPSLFCFVNSAPELGSSPAKQSSSNSPVTKVIEFSSIFYSAEEQLVSPASKPQLNKIVKFCKDFPEAVVALSCHSDESASPAFDLYLGIKRVEKYAAYLIENGVPQQNIVMSSAGSNYPIAENFTNGQVNPSGQSMNRRIDIAINNLNDSLPIRLIIENPAASNESKASKYAAYQAVVKGLHYRVQIAAIKQMYKGDLVNRSDAFLDKDSLVGQYRYYIGIFDSFSDASKLLSEVHEMGVKEGAIVPFFNGARMSEDAIKAMKSTLPDLLGYINFYKIK